MGIGDRPARRKFNEALLGATYLQPFLFLLAFFLSGCVEVFSLDLAFASCFLCSCCPP